MSEANEERLRQTIAALEKRRAMNSPLGCCWSAPTGRMGRAIRGWPQKDSGLTISGRSATAAMRSSR